MIPTAVADYYKLVHKDQYPEHTEIIYSTWTPRGSRLEHIDEVVAYGFQGFIKHYLIGYWNEHFFEQPKDKVVAKHKRLVEATLGVQNLDVSHLESLHDLGYLPIEIKAVPEGTRVPIRCPMLTIQNTLPEFFWLTNFLETIMSLSLWKPSTSATIAAAYRKLLDDFAEETGDPEFVQFQGHDFSMRGAHSSLEDAAISGSGHLLSFVGTDTIPAIMYLEDFYGADVTKELVGTSIPATEHSVMCAGGKKDELETYRRLITEVYPKGFVSIVSDTWDFWHVIDTILPTLKEDIMSRDGRVVIRPDSGDPVDILTGTVQAKDYSVHETLEVALEWFCEREVDDIRKDTPHGESCGWEHIRYMKYKGDIYEVKIITEEDRYDRQYYYIAEYHVEEAKVVQLTDEQKGLVECLYDLFGGEVNAKGYKVLDSHIGCIYGDAITYDRCKEICQRLMDKGFASTNVVFGIGSFTYHYNTRDTFGFALKSTDCVVDGTEYPIFKDPKTDSGLKKSQKGRVVVTDEGDGLHYIDELSIAQVFRNDVLQTIFENGKLVKEVTLTEIRERMYA